MNPLGWVKEGNGDVRPAIRLRLEKPLLFNCLLALQHLRFYVEGNLHSCRGVSHTRGTVSLRLHRGPHSAVRQRTVDTCVDIGFELHQDGVVQLHWANFRQP